MEDGQMQRLVLPFLWLALALPVATAEEPTDTAEREKQVTLEEWLAGKSRSEVIDLLGEPSKKKKRKGKKVFLYAWDGSVTQPPAFPGSGLHLSGAPLPIAASPQPSDLGPGAVRGSKAPPVPPNWRELRSSAESEAESGKYEKKGTSSTALEVTFGADDRVSSCRMVPRKKSRAAKEPRRE
jgi:hypothetical protein